MSLILKVQTVIKKNKSEAHWLYLPKALYEALDRPVAFKVVIGEGKLILTPLKNIEEE